MRKFCEEVLKFLELEYKDSYRFKIEHRVARAPIYYIVELFIEINPSYKRIITNDTMQYLYGWYRTGEFIEERNQYAWQKMLIDFIEGS